MFPAKSRRLGLYLMAMSVALLATAGPGLAFADGGHEDHGDRGVYIALGDSLAVGTGASTPAHLGYVAWIHRATIPGHTTLANLSRGGETSASMLVAGGQLDQALAAIAAPSDVEVVTLDIGGDDLLPLLGSEPCASDPAGDPCRGVIAAQLAGFNANFPTILGTIQAALAADPGDEAFAVMTYYNPFSGAGSPFEAPVDGALFGLDGVIDCAALGNPQNAGLNDLIACTAGALGVTVVDVYPTFAGRGAQLTHILENDVHPNNRGHRVIGRAFIQTLGLRG